MLPRLRHMPAQYKWDRCAFLALASPLGWPPVLTRGPNEHTGLWSWLVIARNASHPSLHFNSLPHVPFVRLLFTIWSYWHHKYWIMKPKLKERIPALLAAPSFLVLLSCFGCVPHSAYVTHVSLRGMKAMATGVLALCFKPQIHKHTMQHHISYWQGCSCFHPC